MVCAVCSAEIADKAIVCYRCGAPTAFSGSRASTRAPVGRSPAAALVLLVIGVVLFALGFALTVETGWVREVTRFSGLALAILAVFRLVRRRR